LGLTFKSPPSITVADQAEKLPDSTPSEKIGSTIGVGEGPSVGVGVGVGVAEAVGVSDGVLVGVNEGMLVDVDETTAEAVALAVGVKLDTEVGVGVLVNVLAENVFVAAGVEVEEFVVTMS
jgi:hypothetical protein